MAVSRGAAPVAAAPPAASAVKARGVWSDALRRFRQDRLAVAGLVVSSLFVLLGVIGPLIAPWDYLSQDLSSSAALPSAVHWLGTDNLGRDTLSRTLWGFQTALAATVVVTGLSVVLGIAIGGFSAEIGGRTDRFLTWLTGLVMTIPVLLLAVLVDFSIRDPMGQLTDWLYRHTGWSVFSTGIYSDYLILFASLSLVFWPHFARLIRGQVLSISETDYVLAARSIGVPMSVLMLRYLVPNALGPIIVVAALDAADIIVLEASLSYLGVGIHPPGASWGSMIQENLALWSFRPHLVIIPAIVLGVTALGIALLGNGLAESLDPRRSREVS